MTITRSRIAAGGGANYVVFQSSGYSGLTVKDTEVMNLAGQVADRAIASFKGTNMTLTGCTCTARNAASRPGSTGRSRDSYARRLQQHSGNHATGVMSLGGTDHVVLAPQHVRMRDGQCSSAISVYPQNDYGGPNDDWTISGNLFNGGGYCVYLGYTPGRRRIAEHQHALHNNSFGTKYHPRCGLYGPVASWSWLPGTHGWETSGMHRANHSTVRPSRQG